VVDVFTRHVLEGNPLAVFPDAELLDSQTMQRIARELNLPETTFVLPPRRQDCAVRFRIFTPFKEMRFAGHPTIGAAAVLLKKGMIEDVTLFRIEEEVGPVKVRVEGGTNPMLWLETPTIHWGQRYDSGLCADVLGLDPDDLLGAAPQLLSAGNPTIFVPVASKDLVDRSWVDLSGMRELRGEDPELKCLFVFTPTPEGAYSRMFAPEYGIPEDPATGSSTGPLAAYMMQHGMVSSHNGARFVSEQGVSMGRRSVIHVRIGGDRGCDAIEIGGEVAHVAKGVMTIPSPSAANI
jgi:trans-2,3-dihydro-3-hydroxyanthranilate isomerase